MGGLSRLYVGQWLHIFGPPDPKVASVTVSLLGSPTAADARPEQEEEDGFAAPEGGKEPEEESTHDPQAAGPRGVGSVFPPIFQEVLPELGVGAPGSVARHLPRSRTLPAHVQVLHHVVADGLGLQLDLLLHAAA